MGEEVTVKTDRLTDFLRVVEEWRNLWEIGERAIYRGHTDFNWILIAKLFRDPDSKPENSIGDDLHQVEKQLLREHLTMEEAHNIEHRLLTIFPGSFMHTGPIWPVLCQRRKKTELGRCRNGDN